MLRRTFTSLLSRRYSAASIGLHRVIKAPDESFLPLPQQAAKLDASTKTLHDTETLIDVSHLELDATSMAQIRQQVLLARDNNENSKITEDEAVAEAIEEIILQRGKMHNPVTDSGGVLVGRVAGANHYQNQNHRHCSLPVGTKVWPQSSVSALPLSLLKVPSSIQRIEGNQVYFKEGAAQAIVSEAIKLVPLPTDLHENVALGALDGSRLLPILKATLSSSSSSASPIESVAIIGLGASGLCALALLAKLHRATSSIKKIVGFDVSPAALADARAVAANDQSDGDGGPAAATESRFAHFFNAVPLDARCASSAIAASEAHFGGLGAHLVLNCAACAGTEGATSILAAGGGRGRIIYFGMATSFPRAVLATDGLGVDLASCQVGAGVFADQDASAFELVRGNHALHSYFLKSRGVFDYVPSLDEFKNCQLTRFVDYVDEPAAIFGEDAVQKNNKTSFETQRELWVRDPFEHYRRLHSWSVKAAAEKSLEKNFWSKLWDYFGIIGEKGANEKKDDAVAFCENENENQDVSPPTQQHLGRTRWFPQAQVSLAENILSFENNNKIDPDSIALVTLTELDAQPRREMSYAELRRQVFHAVATLKQRGVGKSSKVAAILPNYDLAVVFLLAVNALGAVWSALSPDAGESSAVARLGAVEPQLVVACRTFTYNGKQHAAGSSARAVAKHAGCDVLWLPYVIDAPAEADEWAAPSSSSSSSSSSQVDFVRLGFNDPIYMMFTSGTTSLPKKILQSFGVVLNQMKEQQLHLNIGGGGGGGGGTKNESEDATKQRQQQETSFIFTTIAWMVWTWQIPLLAQGCKVVLYDGSPFPPKKPLALWTDVLARERVTYFGSGAKILEASVGAGIHRNAELAAALAASPLRAISSTASPLPDSVARALMRWIPGVSVRNVSGGTEVNGTIVISSPTLPVTGAEIQAAPLGVATDVVVPIESDGESSDAGEAASTSSPSSSFAPYSEFGLRLTRTGESGELCVFNSVPSMPVGFFASTREEAAQQYFKAYFASFGPRVWHHGDFAFRPADRDTGGRGGFVITGRSDATVNAGGVRIGTSDYYSLLLGAKSNQLLQDCLVVDAARFGGIVLFYVVAAKQSEKTVVDEDENLIKQLRAVIRTQLSPKHVPALFKRVEAHQIPYNKNLKKLEILVVLILNSNDGDEKWKSQLTNVASECGAEEVLKPYVEMRSNDKSKPNK